tara:strand:- start:252 stop:590 length:339 start_codon:yes stop_codon:yes gene_type:complete
MGFKIGNIFKKAITGAATWAGNAIGGPTGGKIGGALAASLMSKSGAGGDYEIQNTSQAPVNLGGRVGFERSDEAGSVRGGAKTVDAKEINLIWDRKLMTAMGKNAEYNRTLT